MFAHFGGNWNNSANAGIFYWNLNNSSSNTNVNNGRQTLINNKIKTIVTVGRAKRVVSMYAKAYNLCGNT